MRRRSFLIGTISVPLASIFVSIYPEVASTAVDKNAVIWHYDEFENGFTKGVCGEIILGEYGQVSPFLVRAACRIPFWDGMTPTERAFYMKIAKAKIVRHLADWDEWCKFDDDIIEGHEEEVTVEVGNLERMSHYKERVGK